MPGGWKSSTCAGNLQAQTRTHVLDRRRRLPCVSGLRVCRARVSRRSRTCSKNNCSPRGKHTYVLDGDNIRRGLNQDLGFSKSDRVENIRRVTEVACLLVDAGLVVIVACIRPYRAELDLAHSRFAPNEFLEIHVDAPLEECERRDPKGLYAKARRGQLLNFTGIDSEYEPPESPELRLDTVAGGPNECVELILLYLNSKGLHASS